MPGGLNGQNLKQALISAAPLFSSMAAGYSSGRGPYAYLDQGIAGMQAMQKQKRDEEAAAAAAAAFGGLVPGGMGPAGGAASAAASGAAARGGSAPITFDKSAPQYIADDAMAALGKEPLSMEGRIREGLKARGLPEHVANGFIANFKDESNLNPGINEASPVVPGSRGGFGLAQWTGPRRKALEAFAASQGKPVDDLDVQLDFLMTELSGSEAGAGAAIMSAKNAPEAAAAIVNNFLRPAEQHRASREAEYLGMDAGAPTQADPLADPYVQRLMQVMAMPGLTPEQRSVVELQLQTRMGQLTATAKTEALPAGFRELDLQAQAGGLVPGTPEYQNFMLSGGAGATGGEGPAAFQALHMQALAAGFPEGSPEYQNFMATRGAGLVAESKALGEAKGSAIAGAPAEIAAADETLGFIDEVRKHPGLDAGTGMTSVFNQIPGTSGYDFQNRVNQLLSGGFLTAIDQLRGMGALSNAEGQTATRAISRMDTATSKEEFLAALDDYERVVKQGRERAAGKLESAPATSVAPVKGVTQSGVEWSLGE